MRDGNYLSRLNVTVKLQRPTQGTDRSGQLRSTSGSSSYLALLRAGLAVIPNKSELPNGTAGITADAVGSYPAFSPLPRKCEAVCFLWRFP